MIMQRFHVGGPPIRIDPARGPGAVGSYLRQEQGTLPLRTAFELPIFITAADRVVVSYEGTIAGIRRCAPAPFR